MGFLESDVFQRIIFGGFGVLILREVISGIRTSFSARATEVSLAKLLESDINMTSGRIKDFVDGMTRMIQANNGKATNYVPTLVAPIDIGLSQFSAKLFPLFEKYAKDSLPALTDFYTASESYRMLLTFYRQTFMGPIGISFSGDPHVSFAQRASKLNLDKVDDYAATIKSGISKIRHGHGIWKLMRSKFIYRTLSIVCAILFVFLPERDAL